MVSCDYTITLTNNGPDDFDGVAGIEEVAKILGVMTITSSDPAASVSNRHLGVNAGLGVMVISSSSLGVRAEARYFQDLVGTSQPTGTGIDFGSFHFWRASIGVVIAF